MAETNAITRLAARAMNTRFEIALWGREASYLTAVAEEALREVQALDRQLSFYRDDSDIRRLNAVAASRPVPVDPRMFRLLERAALVSAATDGAFDVTIAPLLRAWGFTGEGGRLPSEDEIAAARQVTGIRLVRLNPDSVTVHFEREGVMLDLGAIGKGYAIERAAEIIRDHEVPGALIHGGTSTVYAVGTQPDGADWTIAVRDPRAEGVALTTIPLRDQALSVSAPHGKSFTAGGQEYGHVLDPRAGRPVQGALLAAVRCPSATDSDALSTALLVRGRELLPVLETHWPEVAALVLEGTGPEASVARLQL